MWFRPGLNRSAVRLRLAPDYLIPARASIKHMYRHAVTHGAFGCIGGYRASLSLSMSAPGPFTSAGQASWWRDFIHGSASAPDEDRMSYEQLLNLAMDLLEKKTKGKEITIDGAAMRQALQKPTGIPVAISKPSEPLPETIQSLGGT